MKKHIREREELHYIKNKMSCFEVFLELKSTTEIFALQIQLIQQVDSLENSFLAAH